ncbi:MAG: type II secretion system major pseudopilin GspG [Gammaproteobacteria bacterium]|nr:type II secretion system major pseudopilin GspG [Gammaproteobacteria bacterium]
MNYRNNKELNTRMQRNGGFTLIEILVVMAIIAMLAVMVAPNLFRQQAGAMRDVARTEISTLEAALDIYRLDVGEYPDSLDGLIEDDTDRASWNGPYLRRSVPNDPWDNEYVYEANGREFTLLSYGADGMSGGEEDDADIGL